MLHGLDALLAVEREVGRPAGMGGEMLPGGLVDGGLTLAALATVLVGKNTDEPVLQRPAALPLAEVLNGAQHGRLHEVFGHGGILREVAGPAQERGPELVEIG